jgi:hypothetical protein
LNTGQTEPNKEFMQIKKRLIVIVSALFAVLCLAQTASAFYAPNLQRWVNRDPIGERGDKNLYRFTENAPSNKHDRLGHFGDTFGGGIGGPLLDFCKTARDKSCVYAVAANARAEMIIAGIDYNNDKTGGNAFQHCVAACQISKKCGEEAAKDVWDGRENPSDPNPNQRQDLENNRVGYSHASEKSCWDACKQSWRDGGLNCGGKPCPPPESPPTYVLPPDSTIWL